MPHFDMYKLLCYFHLLVCLNNNGCVMTEKTSFLCSFDLHVIFALFSVMMPASLLRKRTKTSPKYEQTEATYFFIITYLLNGKFFVSQKNANFAIVEPDGRKLTIRPSEMLLEPSLTIFCLWKTMDIHG